MPGSHPYEGVIVLAGPTASGKSSVAARLARACGAEVVNVDPYQAFRGLEILTAQPDAGENALAPHHLYGCLDPAEERDAAGFAAVARTVVESIRARARRVVLVSGSGLYLRAFSGGLDEALPAPDPGLRARLEERTLENQLGELRQLDPEEWEKIDRRNPRRVTRALEICLLTGGPVSALRKKRNETIPAPPGFCLWPESEALKARIRTRARAMFGPALAVEIETLDRHSPGRSAASTLGLETARAWLDGRLSTEQAATELATRTWQYARRQRTWFKKAGEFTPLPVEVHEAPEDIAGRIRTLAGW